MSEVKSSGGVVFRINDKKEEFLLLKYPLGNWDFSRGLIEKGETELQAAKREIGEETALTNLNQIEGFREEIGFYYTYNKEKFHKKIVYFLFNANANSIVKISFEHKDYIWLSYEEALKKIKHENSRNVLIKAYKFMHQI